MDNKQLFQDIESHLLEDKKPSMYLNSLLAKDLAEQYPYTMLSSLKSVKQSPKHHPEGNVWNHTLMVVDIAAEHREKSNDNRVFMWSALLHDLGKVPATRVRKGRITAYDHDKLGAQLAVDFLVYLQQDKDFIEKVRVMVRWHMQILFVVKGLPFADIKGMLSEVELNEIALLCYCDRMGRGDMDEKRIAKEKENLEKFIELCSYEVPN